MRVRGASIRGVEAKTREAVLAPGSEAGEPGLSGRGIIGARQQNFFRASDRREIDYAGGRDECVAGFPFVGPGNERSCGNGEDDDDEAARAAEAHLRAGMYGEARAKVKFWEAGSFRFFAAWEANRLILYRLGFAFGLCFV